MHKLAYIMMGAFILNSCASSEIQPTRENQQAAAPAAPAAPTSNTTTTAAPAHHTPEGVAPEKALGWLRNGNTRFVKSKLRKDGQDDGSRRHLASGQKPHTIILSCSDSRVPPEIVFDQKLGEIFTVRTAGEAIDTSVLASIEYAVAHLGSRLIVVMGHESCGAVKAALGTAQGTSAGSPSLDALVADIQPRVGSYMRKPASTGVVEESAANARGVALDLVKRSEIIRKAVDSGRVQIKSALYHLGTGEVRFH